MAVALTLSRELLYIPWRAKQVHSFDSVTWILHGQEYTIVLVGTMQTVAVYTGLSKSNE